VKVLSVVGARPQFIKVAPVSRALRQVGDEILVHTGQHYDDNMSRVFFEETGIPEPDHNLGVGSGLHGRQTGRMLIEIERVLLAEQPDWVLVYGDTNSTLAGALAAVKLHIPMAHVEAGLRSFNRRMPEEYNRVLTDHAADLLFCPTQAAVDNLLAEGIRQGVHLVGDVMYDAVLYSLALAEERSDVLARLGLTPGDYALATIHRPRNTDDPARLRAILVALGAVEYPVVFPVHPRTRRRIAEFGLDSIVTRAESLRTIEPVGYLDMLNLERHARLIFTDSGGVQKEAFILAVPCVTLREETEWVETVEVGWNRLVGADGKAIVRAARDPRPSGTPPALYGDGHAAERIVSELKKHGR
jgi:UDP-GlcNAc3NAcA epimerase